jgi:DNA-binding NarL/FixJ family response regulator
VLPITVLVADDERMIRQALADVLEEQPDIAVVGVAEDTAGAVAMARTHHPDVALLDVRMPGGGGVAAARGIRLASPTTRIVAHSAFDDRHSRTAMLAAGAADYLVKGTPAGDIVARVIAAARDRRRP